MAIHLFIFLWFFGFISWLFLVIWEIRQNLSRLFVWFLSFFSPGERPVTPKCVWEIKRFIWHHIFKSLWWFTQPEAPKSKNKVPFPWRVTNGRMWLPAWAHFHPQPKNPKRCLCGKPLWHEAQSLAQAVEKCKQMARKMPPPW